MSEIYRDGSEEAAAHRDDLLRRRRDELAVMPHAVRRVVVARSARIGASVAVIALGAALVALGESSSLDHAIANALPNHPALLTALLATMWGGGVFAWWVARARCEHKFAVAMSRYVLPGRDLDHDLQRLDHEHPDSGARDMAHRLEGRALLLPVVAASVLVPATAIYLAAVYVAGTWPPVSAVETGLADNACAFAGIGVLGIAAAWLFGTFARKQPKLLHVFDGLVLFSGLGAFAAANDGASSAALGLLGVATLALALTVGVRRMLAERRTLGDEVVVIRYPVAAFARRSLAWVGKQCMRGLSRRRHVCFAVALVAFGVGFAELAHQRRAAQVEPIDAAIKLPLTYPSPQPPRRRAPRRRRPRRRSPRSTPCRTPATAASRSS